jgi:membrane protease YdiL (CAAX protease family)
MASIFENLLEPQNLDIAVDSRWWVLLVALAGAGAGLYVIWLLVRRLGPTGTGLSPSEAMLAYPLALAAFGLPAVFIIALRQPLLQGNPLLGALIQSSIALACMFVLANQPWRPGGEERGGWYRAHVKQLRWVPLLWLLGLPVMQLAMFASGLLHELLGAEIQSQEVVDRLRSDGSPGWIFAWYLMAVVAAPLMEEFVFRVALFGGTRRLIDYIVDTHGWPVGILPLTILSIILTVLYAHTRSIWPGVLYHALHNAFVVTMQFYVLK